MLLLLLLTVTLGSLQIPAMAQDEGPELGFQGTFTNPEGEDGPTPVEGVRVEVTDADGAVVGEAVSDAEGAWTVEVTDTGEYTVTVDVESFPDDASLRNPDEPSRTLTVNPGQVRPVLFPIGEGPGPGADSGFDLRLVLQLFVEGIKLGLLIAMMAIGLSLVFGTTQLVNFAHGELISIGAVIAYFFNVTIGMHLILAAILAIIATAGASALMDLGIFRPLRKRGVGLIAQLVITIGLSLFLRYGLLYVFRGDPRSYGNYNIQRGIEIGPIVLPPKDIWSVLISIIVLVGVGLVLQRTKIGRAMRAVSDNRDLAESSGIDVQRVILIVWAVGGGLAAFGGILWGLGESVSWIMGFRLLLPIFAGVILGGIGTAYGALVGSLVVGVFIQMSTLVIPSELKNAAAMVALILILVVRPQGILGRSERVG
ncbi:branched-chain amino acid ABC transporter permease [Nitriliruptoria bacterium AS10]|nr:branched-chain amino acid ABC transporter permease [Salsipaludibacter albus]